jgi:hypothetical protein
MMSSIPSFQCVARISEAEIVSSRHGRVHSTFPHILMRSISDAVLVCTRRTSRSIHSARLAAKKRFPANSMSLSAGPSIGF